MIKVAAYCRVSTDKDDQINSFESQKGYFERQINLNPDWELTEIYADEHAIIGTSGENLVKSRVSALVPFNFLLRASTISFKSQNIIMEGCANHVKNNRSMQ